MRRQDRTAPHDLETATTSSRVQGRHAAAVARMDSGDLLARKGAAALHHAEALLDALRLLDGKGAHAPGNLLGESVERRPPPAEACLCRGEAGEGWSGVNERGRGRAAVCCARESRGSAMHVNGRSGASSGSRRRGTRLPIGLVPRCGPPRLREAPRDGREAARLELD